MPVPPVIHLHRQHHSDQPRPPPHQLLREKCVLRSEPFPRHHRRRRKHHHQPHKHQEQGHSEQPAVDTHALCHGSFISPRRRRRTQKNCGLSIADCCLCWFWVPVPS